MGFWIQNVQKVRLSFGTIFPAQVRVWAPKVADFPLDFWVFGYYLTTSLSKAGMMIVIVKKLLNVSNGLLEVGAEGFMV